MYISSVLDGLRDGDGLLLRYAALSYPVLTARVATTRRRPAPPLLQWRIKRGDVCVFCVCCAYVGVCTVAVQFPSVRRCACVSYKFWLLVTLKFRAFTSCCCCWLASVCLSIYGVTLQLLLVLACNLPCQRKISQSKNKNTGKNFFLQKQDIKKNLKKKCIAFKWVVGKGTANMRIISSVSYFDYFQSFCCCIVQLDAT